MGLWKNLQRKSQSSDQKKKQKSAFKHVRKSAVSNFNVFVP